MQRRSFIALGGAAAIAGCMAPERLAVAAAVPERASPLSDDIDAALAEIRARLGTVAGVAVAALAPSGAYSQGAGLRDVEAGAAADASTAFYIASATKPLTALALSLQAGRADFALMAELQAFAPDAPFPEALRSARLRFDELLCHRAGIAHDPLSYRLAFSGEHDAATRWALLATTQFDAAQRGRFDYSNTGYNIATIITDHVWREQWQDVLDRAIFAPAGMAHSSARRSTLAQRGVAIARPHGATPEGVLPLPLEKTDATMHSAGGVMMSADDALRWLELLTTSGRVGGRQVAPSVAVSQAFSPLVATDSSYEGFARTGYGLGWYSGQFEGRRLVHHFGGFAGARAHVSVLPDEQAGMIVLQNESSPVPMVGSLLARYFYRRLANRTDAQALLSDELDQAVAVRDRYFASLIRDRQRRAARRLLLSSPMEAYAGRYRNPDMGTMTVTRDGNGFVISIGQLRAAAEPHDAVDSLRVELVPQSGAVISFSGQPPDRLRFADQTFQRLME